MPPIPVIGPTPALGWLRPKFFPSNDVLIDNGWRGAPGPGVWKCELIDMFDGISRSVEADEDGGLGFGYDSE